MADSLWKRQSGWAWYVAEDHRLHDPEFRREALECSRGMMRIARHNVQTLVDRLVANGYRFVCPSEAYVPPHDDPADLLDGLEEEGIYVPISLRAWMEEVGQVNLMGSDPRWPFTAYFFPDSPTQEQVWRTDPLVVDASAELIRSHFDEWQWRSEEFGRDMAGRFRIEIAPDEFHKANLSGGASYAMAADRPAVESVVLNERHCLTFVAYLRHCFEWGGFPGFELIECPEQVLAGIRGGLEQF